MKKGQIDLAIFLVLGVVLVTGGTIYTGITIAQSELKQPQGFTGDLDTKQVYDTSKCNVQPLNKIEFESIEQAHSLGFNNAPNCT